MAAASTTLYATGAKLHIQRHLAPFPFDDEYGPNPRPEFVYPDDNFVGMDDVALANPPLETSPVAKPEEHTFTITGSKTLRRRRGDGVRGGAHVVTGYIDQNTATVYVAKIYDGLDYPFKNEDGVDCMTLADMDYAIETWAYKIMQPVATVGGKLVPTYYGAWTFPLDTCHPGRQRWVRMLLLELVEGETMLDKILRATRDGDDDTVQYSLLPSEAWRLKVLKNIIEADMTIWWDAEVQQSDLTARNIMVRDDGSVVILDFNQAMIYPLLVGWPHLKHKKGAPALCPSPIMRYWPFYPGGHAFARPDGPWGVDSSKLATESRTCCRVALGNMGERPIRQVQPHARPFSPKPEPCGQEFPDHQSAGKIGPQAGE